MAIIRLSGKTFVSSLDFPRKCSNACSFNNNFGSSNESIAQRSRISDDLNIPESQIPDSRPGSRSKNPQARRWSQILAILPVYLLQVSYGMNTGYPAIVTPQLRERCSEFSIDENEESWIVSIDNLATPFVCILSGFLQQKFGPLKVLLFACLPYSLGWVTAALATSVQYLYVSRILVGISHALLTTTVYTVEVASRDMRGTYSVLEGVLRCLGCLMIYLLGFAFRWQSIAVFAPAVPLLAFISGFFAPESPVYLLTRHKTFEARRALTKLYGPQYPIEEEIDIIEGNLRDLKLNRKHKTAYIKELRTHPEVYKPFLIIMVLSIMQQFSGMTILRAYVVKIFDELFSQKVVDSDMIVSDNSTIDCGTSPQTGSSTISTEAYISAVILGVVRLFASLLLSKLLQKFRRRSMYFISAFLSILSLISFATCSLLVNGYHIDSVSIIDLKWASLVTACLLVFSVQLGVQTLPYLLSGELFPSDIRSFCKGLTRSLACIFLVVGLKMFPFLERQFCVYGTFYFFAAVLAFSLPVVYCILPETKDMGLEMIQNFFTPSKTIFYVDVHSEVEHQCNHLINRNDDEARKCEDSTGI